MHWHSRPPDLMPLPSWNLFGLRIWATDKPNAVSFRFAVGVTLMPLTACVMDCERHRILKVGKNSGRVLNRLFTKVHEILVQCRDSPYFPTPLPDSLHRVLFRRYSPSSLKVTEKPKTYIKFLAPIFLGGTTPIFLRHIRSAVHCPPFGKVWLSSVCWSPSAGNEVECRIYGGWVKSPAQF